MTGMKFTSSLSGPGVFPLSTQRARRHIAAQADADVVSLQRMLTEPVNVFTNKRRVCPKPLGQQISDQLSLLQDRIGSAWSDAEKNNQEYWNQKASAAEASSSAPATSSPSTSFPNAPKPSVPQLSGQSSPLDSVAKSRSTPPDPQPPMKSILPSQPTPKASAQAADAPTPATTAPDPPPNTSFQFPASKAPEVQQNLPSSTSVAPTPPGNSPLPPTADIPDPQPLPKPPAGNMPLGNAPTRVPGNMPDSSQGNFPGNAAGNMPTDGNIPGNISGGGPPTGNLPGNSLSDGAFQSLKPGKLSGNLPDGPVRFPGNAAAPPGNASQLGNEFMGGGGSGSGNFGGGGGGNGGFRFPGNSPDLGSVMPQPPPGNMPGSSFPGGKLPGNMPGGVPAPRGGFPGNMPDGPQMQPPMQPFADDGAAKGWDWTRLAPGNVAPETFLPDLTAPPKGPQILGRRNFPGNLPPEPPSYPTGPPPPGNVTPPASSIPDYVLRPGNVFPEPMQPRASFPPAGPPAGSYGPPGNYPGPPPGYQGPMPGNMPPGQKIPLGSIQPRGPGGPGWQNMRPPAGNLPPENTPISFNHSLHPDMSSLADTAHTSSASLLHHTVLETSASAVSGIAHGTTSAAPAAMATSEFASGMVDASVAAGAAVGGVQQLSAHGVHACVDDAAHSAACAVAGVDATQLAEVPMHANEVLHGVVVAVADAWGAAGHMLA